MNLPLINKSAVDYVLARGFQIDPFTVFFMSDAPFGKFEQTDSIFRVIRVIRG